MPQLPQHLASTHATGLNENQPIAQFEIGELKNFVYLILDWRTRKAAIVDPQKDLSKPLQALQAHGFELTRILLTHTHHDHVAGIPELARKFPKVPITVHKEDTHRFKLGETLALETFHEDTPFHVGELRVEALHTPGHSRGEACYRLPDTQPPFLFTGDTVFIRDCGRTDFVDGSTSQMFDSLQRIKKLPPKTVILPGHHYAPECASTLERELRESPPFRCTTVAELDALP